VGRYVTRKSTTRLTASQGRIMIDNRSTETLAMLETRNSTSPIGGWIRARTRLKTTIRPKWVGSMPNPPAATGSVATLARKGARMYTAGSGSRKIPTASRTTLTASRKTYLLSVRPVKKDATESPKSSK
jgi:hypothetical protein